MAQGKHVSTKIISNNKAPTITTKYVELIVVNGQLVPDPNEVNPGVNSKNQ